MVLRWSKRNTQKGLEKGKGRERRWNYILTLKHSPQIHSLFFPFTTPSWNDWWLQRRLILYFETPPTLFLLNLYNTVNFPQFQPRDPPEIRPPPSNLTPVLSLSSLVLGAPQTLCRRWFSFLKQAARFVSASGHQVFAYHLLRAMY